jgi:stage II sporulation protein AA (anti-sigma F factor antagonist)
MEFSCTARHADGRVVLTVAGDVDLAAHTRFLTEAEPWAAPPNHLIVDCSGVTFLDSMGLRVLVQLRRLVTEDGRDFALRAPSPAVLRVLELAGVDDLFSIIEAEQETEAASDEASDPDPVG